MIYYSVETERDRARGRLVARGALFTMGLIGGLLFAIGWRLVGCG